MLDAQLVPASHRDSRWLMMVMHGLGDSPAGYAWLPEAMDLPWLNYQLLTAPDHYFGGYSWYDFSDNPGPGIERSHRLVTEQLQQNEDNGYPARQVFLFGFSQGCLMTWEVGLRYPRVLAGCIGVSGYLHETERVLRQLSPVAHQQRFLVTHGTYDSMIPIEPVRRQLARIRSAGIHVTWREFAKEHTIAGEAELSLIRDFVRAAHSVEPAAAP
jgi:phospholipase/carboxylesterase